VVAVVAAGPAVVCGPSCCVVKVAVVSEEDAQAAIPKATTVTRPISINGAFFNKAIVNPVDKPPRLRVYWR